MRKLIAILCCLLALADVKLFAGNIEEADSLISLIPSLSGVERVDMLNEIANLTLQDDPGKARIYANKALAAGIQIDYPAGIGDAHSNLGNIAYYEGNIDSAMFYMKQSLNLRLTLDDSVSIANSYNDIGALHDRNMKPDSALTYYLKSLAIFEKLNHLDGISQNLNNIGVFYYRENELEKALGYFTRSQKIDSAAGNNQNLAYDYSNMGSIASAMEDYDKALQYHKNALRIRRKSDDVLLTSRSLNNIATTYSLQKDYKNATKYYRESLVLKKSVNLPYEVLETMISLAEVLYQSGNITEALSQSKEALGIALDLNASSQEERIYGTLSTIYAKSGDYKAAYEAGVRQRELHDSLITEQKNQKVAEMMAKYEAEGKQLKIEQLNLEKELTDLELEKSKDKVSLLLFGILLVLFIAGFFLILSIYRSRTNRELHRLNSELESRNTEINRQNQEIERQKELLEAQNHQILDINTSLEHTVEERTADLKQANLELDTFFYQSSHALRSPLVRMLGLFELSARETDPETKAKLDENIVITLQRMDNMLRKLNQVSSLSHRVLKPVPLDLEQAVSEVVNGLKCVETGQFDPKQIIIDQEEPFLVDPNIMQIILVNMIENACQFHFQEKNDAFQIHISSTRYDHGTLLTIRDNGDGIPEPAQLHIFEMFYRGSEKSKGDGLGLYVVKKAVEKLQATISMESVPGEFTTFQIFLPKQ